MFQYILAAIYLDGTFSVRHHLLGMEYLKHKLYQIECAPISGVLISERTQGGKKD